MPIIELRSADTAFVIDAGEIGETGGPRLLWFGGTFEPAEGWRARETPPLPGGPDRRTIASLFPTHGLGFFGEPALLAHHDGGDGVYSFALASAEASGGSARLIFHDVRGLCALTLILEGCPGGGFSARTQIENLVEAPMRVMRLAALSLPLPGWAKRREASHGAWSAEGKQDAADITSGRWSKVGRGGRPGFEGGARLRVVSAQTGLDDGPAIGASLAYSGAYEASVERTGDGEARLSLAQWLAPGETILAKGDLYTTPAVHIFATEGGRNDLARRFHALTRAVAPPTRTRRPVHANTWEAAYFSVDEKSAMRLADAAAAIGVERFVLDDGWFSGRSSPLTSLGDWTPDRVKFPSGLAPLAAHVASLGMEFGLWVEPEMVSAESDLYREHPDWILAARALEPPTGRNQLVLDLTRPDVREMLCTSIGKLLDDQPVRYLKWDCNRELYPAVSGAAPAAAAYVEGLYELLARLRAKWPDVSIEACASGGGRMDLGMAGFTDRFWASDSTDPFDRIRIQRAAAEWFPPEMLGAHVGPSPNHWTGRATSMAFRCAVAFFGHFGVELDPSTLDPGDKAVLVRAIEAWKSVRNVLIDGEHRAVETGDAGLLCDVSTAADRRISLIRLLRIAEAPHPLVEPVRIPNLTAATRWKVTELDVTSHNLRIDRGRATSEELSHRGIPPGPRHAGTASIYHLERET